MWWQVRYLVLASISVAFSQIITIDRPVQVHSENITSYLETVNQNDESELSSNENRNSQENEIEVVHSEESAIESGQSKESTVENESAIESRQSEENNMESSQSEDDSQNASGNVESTETPETDEESTDEILSEEENDSENISVENIIEGDIIETDSGPVRGYFDNSTEIQHFLDIPYGKITGAFEAPTQPESWEDIHYVTQHKTLCPQLSPSGEYKGQLDCLTLSIFAHNGTKNASVLFHIHDGDFVSGSGDSSIYGPNYIVPKGVILILPNYRLGPLGFLCLRNETAQGNAALKDLTLALNWTKRNIASFGGNALNIVVSGGGSGGALAGYLALSKKSSAYISKVIVDSGSVLSHWALDREPIKNAKELAEKIQQSIGTDDDNVFEDIEAPILINASKNMTSKPCIETENDEAFLTDTPWNILHNEKNNISFMLGSANHAGAVQALAYTEESLKELNEHFQNILPSDLKFENDAQKDYIAERVKVRYFNDGDVDLDKVANLSLCYTDMSYLSPEIRAARPLIRAGVTVFFYEFSYVGELNMEPISVDTKIIGATKGDTMRYIFSKDTVEIVKDSDDEKMVNLLTDLWTSFIKTGEPTANDVEWNKLETTEVAEEEWLLIGPETKLQKGLHLDRLSLWSEIYDQHFVDRSQAVEYKPCIYSILISTFIFLYV